MGGLRGIGLLAAALLATHAAPALAADHVVTLGNSDQLAPTSVTINPKDTVTWSWVGPETNHSPESVYGQAEYWDADPGDDGAFPHGIGFTFSHQFKASGLFRYRCTVHPDTMQGEIVVRGPDAVLTAQSTAVINEPVTFDASGSTGTGLKYKWDLDGDGTFDVGRTHAQETITYTTGQRRTIKVQATDTSKRYSIAQLTITPRDPAPVAAFLVTPSVTRPNLPVTFDATGTTDPDGDITSYEWDLDGDPATGPDGFEVGTGPDPQVKRTFQGTGPRQVRLRVTDAAGHSSIAVEELTITNLVPTADFSVDDRGTRQGVMTFDASGSSDPDGTIVRYEWDANGDGVFEGASASPKFTTTYTAAGTYSVGLRVTDNGGATTTTVRTVRVEGGRPLPGGGTPPPPPAVLRLTVGGQAVQRALRTRRVVVRASCTAACSVVARGSVSIAGRRSGASRRAAGSMPAGGRLTLRLGLPAAVVSRLRRALAARRRATVKVDVVATGAGSSRVQASRRVVVRR